MLRPKIGVLLAAAGASWETTALRLLGSAGPGVTVLKRCVDLPDLLATASTGQAQVVVVSSQLPGLDADSVARLHRAGLEVVAVLDSDGADVAAGDRLGRIGIARVVLAGSLAGIREAVVAVVTEAPATAPRDGGEEDDVAPSPSGATPGGAVARAGARTIAVWGPRGAPGRTTLAVGVSAELADRGLGAFLIDADGYGGAVAQHLGILDQASGLLAAARLANSGQLDHEQLASAAREVSSGFRLLTGLPRADRWVEVREAAFGHVLDLARGLSDVLVLDTSFSLEQEPTGAFGRSAPRRNGMTLEALEAADEVLVVGSADPVGLARLARGLVELVETVPGCAVRVAVNRNRASLGWGEQEVRAMIEGFLPVADVHFLPDDQGAADRALASGKSLVEIGDSPLRRAIAGVVDAMTGHVRTAGRPRATAGGARSEETGSRWTLPGRARTGGSRARVGWTRPSRPFGQAARGPG